MSVELPTNSTKSPDAFKTGWPAVTMCLTVPSGRRIRNSTFVSRLFTDCSFDRSLPLASILRLSAPQPFFPSRHALIWIEAIYPIPLLVATQGGSTRHAPDPTPRMREPLRLRQITLAPPQRFFRPLVLAGVRH